MRWRTDLPYAGQTTPPQPAKKFGKINILSLSSAHLQARDPRRPSGCPGPLAKDPRGHPSRDPGATRNRPKPALAPGSGEEAVAIIHAHDLAAPVDHVGPALVRAGHVEHGVAASHVPQEAVAAGGKVLIRSDDLAGVVDPIGKGPERAGHVDRGKGVLGLRRACKANE